MYASVLLMSAAAAATAGLPYFHLDPLFGLPIQPFGVIVAIGLVIGTTPMRRYAEWHGVADDHIRGLMTWVMITGFLGAHWFDVLAYQWHRIGEDAMATPASWWPGFMPASLWPSNWPLGLRIWDGISSYGGFIGGALGFAFYVWWKRLPVRLFADITIVGLLLAFSIGRIGCTVVSDHIGAVVDPDSWYAFLAQDYPRRILEKTYTGPDMYLKAWNLGLLEFLWLVPVNVAVVWLAFRPSKRMPAGFITVLTGVLYAPVRFFLDFLRPEDTDPRGFGLTFAQWASILAFGIAVYAARRILKTGAPAETIAPTSREAQEQLRIILRDDDDVQGKQAAEKKAADDRKKAELARLRAERDREDAELEAAERAKAAAVTRDEEEDDDEEDDAPLDEDSSDVVTTEAAKPASQARKSSGTKPAGAKPAGAKPSGNKPAASKSSASKNRSKSRKR
jgi:phosphatidylglycerol---prolipoprotein diacylglyceryl transferase